MIGEMTPLQKERQQKILQTAAKYFAHVHYHEADMETIAKEAGVGKGTLYRYFKNKDDLYLNTIQYLSIQAFDYLHHQAQKAKSFQEYIGIIIDTAIDYFLKHPETFSMVLMSSLTRIRNIIEAMESVTLPYLQNFRKRSEQAVAAGEIRPLNPDIVYKALFSMIIDAVHTLIMRQKGSADEFKQTLKSLILNGLVREKEQ